MALDRQPQMSSIGAVVLRGCGCVEDHGLVALHHKDPEVVREWFIHRLHHFHGHSLEEAEDLSRRHPDDLYKHVMGLPAATPKVVAKCFVHTHDGKGIAGGVANPLVVDLGFAIETNLLSGAGTVPNKIQWGVGNGAGSATAPAHGDTVLQSPSAEARVTGTVTRTITSVANDTLQVVGTITSATTQRITEAGLFDATPTLAMRGIFTEIDVNSGDSIAFTMKIQET